MMMDLSTTAMAAVETVPEQRHPHEEFLALAPLPPDTPIEDLGFKIQTYNLLRREGVETLGDLLELSLQDITAYRGVGPTTIQHIKSRLKAAGYRLVESRVERIQNSLGLR